MKSDEKSFREKMEHAWRFLPGSCWVLVSFRFSFLKDFGHIAGPLVSPDPMPMNPLAICLISGALEAMHSSEQSDFVKGFVRGNESAVE